MRTRAIVFSTIGGLLLAFEGFSFLNSPYDTSKGFDFLLGQILFDVFIAVAGILLIIAGVRSRREKK